MCRPPSQTDRGVIGAIGPDRTSEEETMYHEALLPQRPTLSEEDVRRIGHRAAARRRRAAERRARLRGWWSRLAGGTRSDAPRDRGPRAYGRAA